MNGHFLLKRYLRNQSIHGSSRILHSQIKIKSTDISINPALSQGRISRKLIKICMKYSQLNGNDDE